MKPKLTLVGAGPGNGELITLKGIRTLRQADVVLYDDLANDSLLEFAPEFALKMYVGKRAGKASLFSGRNQCTDCPAGTGTRARCTLERGRPLRVWTWV